MHSRRNILAILVVCCSAIVLRVAEAEDIDFGKVVRPILSDHCYACHGPDENHREAGIRLDTNDGVADVIDPDDLDESEILARIVSDDEDSVMPPPEFHKPLSAEQKQVLRKWVQQGAAVAQHWAFAAPIAGDGLDSAIGSAETAAHQVDGFLDEELASVGLHSNGPADRPAILRRVCLDLTGLPPTRDQIQRFMSDTSPEAYENLVDRLLESEAFGQHIGRHWLDLVRYADTHGLHLDNYREMWPYRDWVIDAINANMPFDEFLKRQLAGDLLDDPTDADLIASGFNRLNVTTNEGGSIYDEVFARNCIDRTDAFGTIFLGLTTGCSVCHDHKFDPITQHDYYSLLAFFNSLDGRALDGNSKNPSPVISVPSDEQRELLASFDTTLAELRKEMRGPIETVDQAQLAWERSLSDNSKATVHVLHPSSVESEADRPMVVDSDGVISLTEEAADKDTTVIIADLPAGTLWQSLHLQALVDKPDQRVGASSNGNVVLSEVIVQVTDDELGGEWLDVPITGATADIEQKNGAFAVSYAIDGQVKPAEGWAVEGFGKPGPRNAWFAVPSLVAEGKNARVRIELKYQSQYEKHQFRKIKLSLSDSEFDVPESEQIKVGPVHTVGPFPIESPNPGYSRSYASQKGKFNVDEEFRYEDRPYRWQHRNDLIPVKANAIETVKDRATVVVLHQKLAAPRAQDVTLLMGCDDGAVLFLNGKEIKRTKGPRKIVPLGQEIKLSLKKGDNDLYIKLVNHAGQSQLTYAYRSQAIPVPDELRQLVAVPRNERSSETVKSLQKYYRLVRCQHPDWVALVNLEKGTQKSKTKLEAEIPTTLVWKDTKEPRKARILNRGQYDQPGDEVVRDTPGFLPEFPKDAPRDRFGLATWLTDSNHPLTARVAVNRYWQHLFGTGLVKTSEDFGNQGESPSHPALLDHLAVYFQRTDWDVKQLIKTLVLTEAYRRDASVDDTMLRTDPNNRLLARGPRHRLDAEVLRDQALVLSGTLNREAGGPSIKPPQPDGLWKAVGYSGSNTVKFTADKGDKVYRRSVYVFWKRTSPPPQMSTLDAPSRESCTARRERTNTPLQALLLMNEVQYLEASKKLAQRVTDESSSDDVDEQINWLFETVTAREPTQSEQLELKQLFGDLANHYDANPTLATQFIGSSDATQAAWTVLASTMLNLDEVVNK